MSSTRKVAVLVGSLREKSFSRLGALAVSKYAPRTLQFQVVEIGTLPLYNQDRDDNHAPPEEWVLFRERIKSADAVLFVTPEYNRSVPGVLKNAIDVGSRPYGQSVWNNKPAAVMSVSPGAIGGFGANHHLRQSLVFLNMPTMQQPEAYVGTAATLFGEDGAIENEATRSFFTTFAECFAHWIERTQI